MVRTADRTGKNLAITRVGETGRICQNSKSRFLGRRIEAEGTPMTGRLYFDQITAGQSWISPSRTITETDVVTFAAMTGDFNPLHIDHEFARKTPFGQPIAHGLLGLSWVAGLGSQSPDVATAAFLGIREWRFIKPIYFGDTLSVTTEVVETRPSGRRRGAVVWRRKLVNQNGETVQEGLFETLVEISAEALARTSRSTAVAESGLAPIPRNHFPSAAAERAKP